MFQYSAIEQPCRLHIQYALSLPKPIAQSLKLKDSNLFPASQCSCIQKWGCAPQSHEEEIKTLIGLSRPLNVLNTLMNCNDQI